MGKPVLKFLIIHTGLKIGILIIGIQKNNFVSIFGDRLILT